MSIQRMPYPPYVKIDMVDTVFRIIIVSLGVTIFLITLCVETNYASKEKFIGINVSILFFLYIFCTFLITKKYLFVLLFSGFNGNEWSQIGLQFA